MSSLAADFLQDLSLPSGFERARHLIERYQARQPLYARQPDRRLQRLRRQAEAQSIEAANRIEGIAVEAGAGVAVLNRKPGCNATVPLELAGYHEAMNCLRGQEAVPLPEASMLEIHAALLGEADGGGHWRSRPGLIGCSAQDMGGDCQLETIAPEKVAPAIGELNSRFAEHMARQAADPVMLSALYLLDFLCIRPFDAGNCRVSRLLSMSLLQHQGLEVVRYVSLDMLTEKRLDEYASAFFRSIRGWGNGQHDPQPWISFWYKLVIDSYRQMESWLMPSIDARMNKEEIVLAVLDEMPDDFTTSELAAQCPMVSREWIQEVLHRCLLAGHVTQTGHGRGAMWHKSECAHKS